MRKFPQSPLYSVNPEGYRAEREQRMVGQLDDFLWKCFIMLGMNEVEGDYLEFGSGSNVRSFRLAYKYKKLEYDRPRLFAFDSFEGLPAPTGSDVHHRWRKGSMRVSLKDFQRVMGGVGASEDEYDAVQGYYEETLDKAGPAAYGIEKAAMVFVDCDLYASTVSVLNFASDILANGAILAFDDWYCFNGDPDKGEQRAFREFCEAHPAFRFSEYLNFGWHGKSFIVHRS